MRSYLFLPSLLLLVVLWLMPTTDDTAAEQAPTETLAESQNQLIKFTDEGTPSNELRMKKDDRIVFFLNDTTDSLLTLEVSFGSLTTHCSSENLRIGDNGLVASTIPIVPKDFASTCFHDAGTYPYTVFGLKKYPQGLKGTIIIE
jgi:hypothetical protein